MRTVNKKWLVIGTAVAALWVACCASFIHAQVQQQLVAQVSGGTINVYFSPRGGCVEAIVQQIDTAEQTILVQAYRLTSIPVVEALVRAKDRGVSISIILDRTQQSDRYSDATYFHNHQMPVLIDASHPIAHNKVMIIDQKRVITGSYNFSANAERNAENLLIIQNSTLAKHYVDNFNAHKLHSNSYVPPP
jgi:phosphatidylserine/phosphatidylglycerophosphate/cardiolipin synthase-like enzyme